MNKHSPGPWTVRKMGLHEESSDSLNGIEVTDAEGNAVCCNQPFYPTALKPENAHLIAAAPDLLEALNTVMNIYGYYITDDIVKGVVQAAIKKAKGEM